MIRVIASLALLVVVLLLGDVAVVSVSSDSGGRLWLGFELGFNGRGLCSSPDLKPCPQTQEAQVLL